MNRLRHREEPGTLPVHAPRRRITDRPGLSPAPLGVCADRPQGRPHPNPPLPLGPGREARSQAHHRPRRLIGAAAMTTTSIYVVTSGDTVMIGASHDLDAVKRAGEEYAKRYAEQATAIRWDEGFQDDLHLKVKSERTGRWAKALVTIRTVPLLPA